MELHCSETYGIKRAFEDSVLIDDSNVLEILFLSEEEDVQLLPDSDFYDKCDEKTGVKPEIKPFMRKIVANWMLEV